MYKISIFDNTPGGSTISIMYKIYIKVPPDRFSEASTDTDIRS